MTAPTLKGDARRVLTALAECKDGRIEGRRIIPYPHRFHLKIPGMVATPSVSSNSLHALLSNGLVGATPRDFPLCDHIDYAITGAGRELIKSRRVATIEPNLEMFGPGVRL